MAPLAELELKAVVADPAALARALRAAGARPCFRGYMQDQRFDRNGELGDGDTVLRIRSYRTAGAPGAIRTQITWKGPTGRSPEGYKQRQELEYELVPGPAVLDLFLALGYTLVQEIDRYVEIWELDGASLRVEWYPRMDVLLEVEGPPSAIEGAIRATRLPREIFLPDALVEFVARYQQRTGHRAVLTAQELPAGTAWAPQ